VEAASAHPSGRALAAAAGSAGGLPPVTGFAARAGLGVTGTVGGVAVQIGRTLPGLRPAPGGPDLDAARRDAEATGRTAVLVGWHGAVRAVLVVGDTLKPTSAEAVRRLAALGLRPVLLTGDSAGAARTVAAVLGIPPGDVIAEVLPADKVGAV